MEEYDPYLYKCDVVDVVDGDTLDVVISLGFHLTKKVRIRLLGVNTHETYGVSKDAEEYKKGMDEAKFVKNWVNINSDDNFPFWIRTRKKGKYGRYLAYLFYDGETLNQELVDNFEGVKSD